MRYEKINDYYIQDTYTGKKLTLNDIVTLLNVYEENTQKDRRKWICQTY